jgi:enterochelin esterase-like enzyme
MKDWKITLILSSLLLPCNIFAQSKVVEGCIKSEVLNVEREYSVYLPKSYSILKDRKYPVLYLLHGLYDNNKGWFNGGDLQNIADRIIDDGKADEMIIVVPDASAPKDGYFNVEGWPYETFFFDEFIPFIEKTYRIFNDKSHRAIAGYSMGGGGAAAYALKHPEFFSSVYAMSALMSLPKQKRKPVMDRKMAEFGRSVLANDCISVVSYADETTLKGLRTVHWFVDCGDDDFLLDVNTKFYEEMRNAQVPCEFRVRDGNHNWEYWHSALYVALPFISENFGQ